MSSYYKIGCTLNSDNIVFTRRYPNYNEARDAALRFKNKSIDYLSGIWLQEYNKSDINDFKKHNISCVHILFGKAPAELINI